MPIQADFILRRLHEMAEADPALRTKQPWQAAYERDFGWFGTVLEEHYAGNDTNVRTLLGGVIAAHAGISVDDFEAQAHSFLHTGRHPTLDRAYLECAYAPMVELLQYLEANGFANYIASGGGRDFMRPISDEMYGIPRDRVIGSSTALDYTSDDRGGTIMRKPEADVLDDGPEKPIRIWSRVGRRPLLAAGNSNGDIPMLDFAQHADKPFLRLLVLHDDADREFDYTPAQRLRWSGRRRRAGRWSASRTTGRQWSSATRSGQGPPLSAVVPESGVEEGGCDDEPCEQVEPEQDHGRRAERAVELR